MATELAVIDQDGQLTEQAQEGPGPLLPLTTPQGMRRAMQLYDEMFAAIISEDDVFRSGKGDRKVEFLEDAAFNKLGVAFGLSVDQTAFPAHPKWVEDEEGNPISVTMQTRLVAPNGRYGDGIGICHISEANFWSQTWGGNGKPTGNYKPANRDHLHQAMLGTADTRAKKRAYQALTGKEPPTEEQIKAAAGRGEPRDSTAQKPQPEHPQVTQPQEKAPQPAPQPAGPQGQAGGPQPATTEQRNTILRLSSIAGDAAAEAMAADADLDFHTAASVVSSLSSRINEANGVRR